MRRVIYNLYQSIIKMIDHDGVEHSGYMSFMLLVSIFPFFVFFLAFTSFIGVSEVGEKFIQLALENLPDESVSIVKNRISELMDSPPQRLLTLAILGTLWTSSSFVECLRTILNRVYELKTPPNYLFRRFLSILQFLLISLVIGLVMFLLILTPIALQKMPQFMKYIEDYTYTLNLLRYTLIVVSLFFSASALYYVIPNVSLSFLEVIPGAVLTVILWIMCGFLLFRYIGYYNQLNIVYGSLGSIIITLIFFYIVNMIFIIGAEFNFLMKNN